MTSVRLYCVSWTCLVAPMGLAGWIKNRLRPLKGATWSSGQGWRGVTRPTATARQPGAEMNESMAWVPLKWYLRVRITQSNGSKIIILTYPGLCKSGYLIQTYYPGICKPRHLFSTYPGLSQSTKSIQGSWISRDILTCPGCSIFRWIQGARSTEASRICSYM